MKYAVVAEYFEKLEQTSGRLQMTEILSDLFKETPKAELPILAYLMQGKLRPDFEGVELGIAEKLALRALSTASGKREQEVKDAYIKAGDIGSAAEALLKKGAGRERQGSLFSEPLTLKRVYDSLLSIAKTSGGGSIESKLKELVSLINDATPVEAKYILRTAMGVLRLGVADYTILDAAAVALLGDKAQRKLLERAYNVTSDLGFVIGVAAERGVAGVRKIHLQVGKPIRPMLAERLGSAQEILDQIGKPVAAEYKLDGERLQMHKSGEKVELFSRRLERITANYPDVVRYVKSHVKSRRAVLEGEVVAINANTGEYLPFQELMHRRRKHGIEEMMKQYPVAVNFFDALYVDTKDITGLPYVKRRAQLERVVEVTEFTRPVPAKMVETADQMERFMELAIEEGCEGIVAKKPDGTYRAGAREFSWIKLKREYSSELTDTIDLVVIGAFHGKGRRAGVYGTYLLAAYDSDRKMFPSATKIGTGFSDADLERFPKLLKPYESQVKPPNVESNLVPDIWYRPKVVIETIASEITLSPIHPAAMNAVREGSGLALRFPKFTGKIRDEKGPEDATTVKELIEMYSLQKRVQSKA
ncbi:MAG TPA: ATP-dependent DNA ligase [Nitrososphaerales archaeon]|nr:ATP-dependent DNA ligase [Nitrososphaerales archaeon]